MNKELLIEQLIKARKISTDEEFHTFENTLAELDGNINENDISELCKAFDDDTSDDEVMFLLVHLIEAVEGDGYLKTIAHCSPDMKAREWAKTLNRRILNSDGDFNVYAEIICGMNGSEREKILRLLSEIKQDNEKRFGAKVDKIAEKAIDNKCIK